MTTDNDKSITVLKDGPYLVAGNVPLELQTIEPDDEGSWEWAQGRAFETKAPYALCRCGESGTKPFCDGTHAKIGFNGNESASREPYSAQAKTFEGPALVLEDAPDLCAVARFCDNHGTIWKLIEGSETEATRELVEHEATRCPSGRLVVRERASGSAVEPHLPPSIGVVEDPGANCSGPLWVRGGITVRSSDGFAYEVRNRVTLCRCGRSQNKPFCDGSHTEGEPFVDGLTTS